jgi:hypothetical protein
MDYYKNKYLKYKSKYLELCTTKNLYYCLFIIRYGIYKCFISSKLFEIDNGNQETNSSNITSTNSSNITNQFNQLNLSNLFDQVKSSNHSSNENDLTPIKSKKRTNEFIFDDELMDDKLMDDKLIDYDDVLDNTYITPMKKQKENNNNNAPIKSANLETVFSIGNKLPKKSGTRKSGIRKSETKPKTTQSEPTKIEAIRKSLRTKSDIINHFKKYILNLTPAIKELIHPDNLEHFESMINEDNIQINKFNEDNQYKENYGKLIEIWIADNMKCPCCKQKTLKRYVNNNFPIIDLVCINPNHDNGVTFFQVKTSEIKEPPNKAFTINGYPYFSLENKTIMVGSVNWGMNVHNIKGNDYNQFSKNVLIGYICILFVKNNNNLEMDMLQSFVVLPYINVNDDRFYYEYVNKEEIIDNNQVSSSSNQVSSSSNQVSNIEANTLYTTNYPVIKFDSEMNYITNFLGQQVQYNKNKTISYIINTNLNNNIYLDTNIIPINYDKIMEYKEINNPLDKEI